MRQEKIVYFDNPGSNNTETVLRLAAERVESDDICKALVASTSGVTGLAAMEVLIRVDVIVVSHSYGFSEVNKHQLSSANREAIEGRGGKILTCQHAFGGVGRSVRKKFGTYQVDEIMAQTLRNFGEGTKVCVEMVLMATDAGLVNYGENVLAVAGSDNGADTALIIKAANAQSFFDLRIQEIICKPLF